MRKNIFFIIILVLFADIVYANEWKPVSGEMAIGFQGIRFKELDETKPLLAIELGSRNVYYGYSLLLGSANIENRMFEVNNTVYSESIDYMPLEFNIKGYYPMKDIEIGLGGGVSMNYLSYILKNENAGINVVSKDNLLFGAQLKGEVKILFPSTSGVDAFVAIEYVYQFVEKTNTFLGSLDLSNQRFGIKLGGRF
ncbi:MAG: hypothetical protein N2999_04760 [Proteobacteria bacterium]|nr:hypothetical protein [Pseudomonadota bacterium]